MQQWYLAILPLFTACCLACQKIDFTAQGNDGSKNGEAAQMTADLSLQQSDVHVIAISDTVASDKVDVIYISLNEWSNMTSTFSPMSAQEARDIANSYYEGTVTGWHIPTLSEAIRLKAYYDANPHKLDELNSRLGAMGAQPLSLVGTSGETYRYLCAGGDSTFSMRKGYATLKAGATVKYHLRLVKDSSLTIVPKHINFEY